MPKCGIITPWRVSTLIWVALVLKSQLANVDKCIPLFLSMNPGLDQSKHNLAPVLRPYLNKLFVSSHEMSWHLDGIREQRDEIEALGAFNRLVNTTEVSPASGLIESVNKGWNWARNMLRLVERASLRVVFTPDRSKLHRHILKLPSYERRPDCPTVNGLKSLQGTLKERKIGEENTSRTLPSRRFQEFFCSGEF